LIEGDKMIKKFSVLVVAAIALQGCASIVSGTTQPLSVETRGADGVAVAGASCKLSNDKGKWFVNTPGSVSVSRSFNDMIVDCSKEKYAPGVSVVKSTTKAMAAGNILFGGVIGVGVDIASGAAYDYPNTIAVEMAAAP
jgi:hypothetical protein